MLRLCGRAVNESGGSFEVEELDAELAKVTLIRGDGVESLHFTVASKHGAESGKCTISSWVLVLVVEHLDQDLAFIVGNVMTRAFTSVDGEVSWSVWLNARCRWTVSLEDSVSLSGIAHVGEGNNDARIRLQATCVDGSWKAASLRMFSIGI